MAYNYCRHIRTNGRRCQAPALKNESWCYFHNRLHFRHRAVRPVGTTPGPNTVDLPAIEDRDSVQVALSLVLNALALGKLDEGRARAMFQGLNIAARNLDLLVQLPTSYDRVMSYMPTLDGFAMAPAAANDGSTPIPRRKSNLPPSPEASFDIAPEPDSEPDSGCPTHGSPSAIGGLATPTSTEHRD